jgi:hypothetical protein
MAAGGDDETVTAEGERPLEAAPSPGTAGPYRLVELLGAGGMGTVWRARDEVLLRDVAVKRLPPERAGHAEARARMLREARAQAALNHPHVCTIHQAGEDGDGVWIAMELLAGPSLDVKLRAAPVAALQVASWGADIARALAAAHARGLVHRDLKPSNVMLDAAGRVKVTDFGLVKLVGGDAHGDAAASPAIETTLTRDGAILGSPRYMSPEQARGDDVGPPSDVFSLGVVLYELASGARAFEGAGAMETIAAILKDEPRPLREVAKGVPPAFAALVHRCLARDPAVRPTAGEVADALAAPMPAARRSRRGLAFGLAVTAVLGAAAIVASLASRGSEPDEPAALAGPTHAASLDAGDPLASSREVELLAKGARPHAVFDPSGRYVFFTDTAKRLWRSVDGGAPTAVSGLGPVEDVTCCWQGRIVAIVEARPVAVSPSSLDVVAMKDLADLTTAYEVAFSEDGRRFAVTRERAIEISGVGGTSPARTLPLDGEGYTPRVSPNGRWVAFALRGAKDTSLMLVDAERPSLEAVRVRALPAPSDGDIPHGIAWVATDRLIVLDTCGAAHEPCWRWLRVGGDGGASELGASVVARPQQPLASDGHRVVALESRPELDIAVADFDGNRMGALQPQQAGADAAVGDWRRDHRLVVTAGDAPTKSTSLAMLVPGGSPTPLLPADPGVTFTALSIVDHAMYFLRTSEHVQTSLWAADDDGHGAHQLVETPHAFELSCGVGVCAVTFKHADKHDVQLFDLTTSKLGPVLREAGDYYGLAAVSRDGRYVAVGVNSSVWIYDRQRRTGTERKIDGLTWVQSIAFSGDDLILADTSFAPGTPALLRVKPSGDVEVLASDADWYNRPTIDTVAQRIAVQRRHRIRGLRLIDLPPPPR